MGISQKDEVDLIWYLGEGGSRLVGSSVTGAMLQRALEAHFDSEDNVIPTAAPGCMKVSKRRRENGYMPDYNGIVRWMRVSRIHNEVTRRDENIGHAISLFYGDVGARWAREKVGRNASIYPITAMGKTIVDRVRRKTRHAVDQRQDEIIVGDFSDQALKPNDIRRQQHLRLERQADVLSTSMAALWREVAAKVEAA